MDQITRDELVLLAANAIAEIERENGQNCTVDSAGNPLPAVEKLNQAILRIINAQDHE